MKNLGRFVHVSRHRPKRVAAAAPEVKASVVPERVARMLAREWPGRGAVQALFREAARRRA